MVLNQRFQNKWVGLLEIEQLDGIEVLGKNRGAHVTAIAWCREKGSYKVTVESALADNGLKLKEAEEVETCEERVKNYKVDDKFMDAVAQVSQENPVVFMSFHTYPINDE